MPLASPDFTALDVSYSVVGVALYVAFAWTAANRLQALGRPPGWSIAESVFATPIVGWLDVIFQSRRAGKPIQLPGWFGLYVAASIGVYVVAALAPDSFSIHLTIPAILLLVVWAIAVGARSRLAREFALVFNVGFGLGWLIVGTVEKDPCSSEWRRATSWLPRHCSPPRCAGRKRRRARARSLVARHSSGNSTSPQALG